MHNGSAMVSLGYKRSRFFCDSLNNEKAQLEATPHRYVVPGKAAFTSLEATVLRLFYNGESVETPGSGWVSKIRNSCRRSWVGRKVRPGANRDEAFPGDRLPYAQRS